MDVTPPTRPPTSARRPRPCTGVLPGLAAAVLLLSLLPAGAASQQTLPVVEDADLPPAGEVRLRAGPARQAWHREFGPGPGGGRAVPLARDWSGPLLEKVHPGPELFLEPLNRDAGVLGFEPVEASEASLGTLEMRELSADVRTLALRVEVGLPWGLAVDATVPAVRTEVEPFGAYDPSGATLGSAGRIFSAPGAFFDAVSSARADLQDRLDGGQLAGEEADLARRLLARSAAFADALQARVQAEALVPLADTPAGEQLLGHYGSLRDGFGSFGLSLPELTLPADADPGLLDAVPGDPLSAVQRGWAVGEPELGLRFRIHDDYTPGDREQALETRTAVGLRARLPLSGGEGNPFLRPDDPLGVPPGDGQRDLELSLYQGLRWRGRFTLDAVARYGLQRPEVSTVRVRSPDRPLAPPAADRRVQRDLGDYFRLRLAPRFVLNRFLSVGGEYRLWHKGGDRYRVLGGGGDARALELETEQTRHRVGLGAFYRPDPPAGDEASGGVPELGLVWQRAVSGSGGEVPAADLVTFHLRVPIHVF